MLSMLLRHSGSISTKKVMPIEFTPASWFVFILSSLLCFCLFFFLSAQNSGPTPKSKSPTDIILEMKSEFKAVQGEVALEGFAFTDSYQQWVRGSGGRTTAWRSGGRGSILPFASFFLLHACAAWIPSMRTSLFLRHYSNPLGFRYPSW